MKKMIRATAAALAIAACSTFPTSTPAYTIHNPTQYYWVLSDGYSLVATYNQADWQLWDTGWNWGDFIYGYFEEFTNQWTRHWTYDFESARWVYCYTVNYENFN
jgi:hypothetical protein